VKTAQSPIRKPLLTLLAFALLIGAGCTTDDFKVVDALHTGMSREEARATISAYGFERREFLTRPEAGWSSVQTMMDLPKRAAAIEERRRIPVGSAEYYPVGHGLMGFGELFLFYDVEGRLVEFYRHNIN
jgi:hypothetical protein